MRILVVEDARSLGATLRRALQEEGYAVDLATDGVDGLWRAKEFDYDAIVLDPPAPRTRRTAAPPRMGLGALMSS